MELLKQLCKVFAPSGDEGKMRDFILDYVEKNAPNWKARPTIFSGDGWQDNIVLVFGKPRTAIIAHMDSIGFTVKYNRQLVKLGKPVAKNNYVLVGEDSQGPIECELKTSDEGKTIHYHFEREIDRATDLVFKCDFRTSDEFVQSCYLDNRLGCWNALKVAETLENGIIIFSCNEEHSGGSVPYLAKFIYEEYGVKQALISDITWVTDGVKHGKGVVLSMRDMDIPRKAFLRKIIGHAKDSGVDFQLEVEDAGGSDGHELQKSPYPFDWAFIGAPEDHVHSPDEKVHKHDIDCMVKLYQYLMEKL